MRIALGILIAVLFGSAAAAETLKVGRKDALVETFVTGLEHPWSIAFLPDGRALVTERPGRLRIVGHDGSLSEPVSGLLPVDAQGQGGLLGMALDPGFAANRTVYLCHAEPRGGANSTSVMRGILDPETRTLAETRIVFRQEPPANSGHHFGCRLVFDRDGALFITTGDRNSLRELVQDGSTHIGKVIRIRPDGTPAGAAREGWLPEIWSIGHRNIQGAALDPATGRLWTVEHGARGGDEVNAPEAGRNYGWPVISYGREYSGAAIGDGLTAKDGMEQPLHYWDPSIAPSGLAFYSGRAFPEWKDSIFVGALAGEKLVRLSREGFRITGEEDLLADRGQRIRDVVEGPDGFLYLAVDAPNGEILRIRPAPVQ